MSNLSATPAAKGIGIKVRQVKIMTSQKQRKKRATAVQMWDHVEDRASRRDLANKQIHQIKNKILRAEQNSDLVQLYAAIPETGNAAVYATGNVDFKHGMLAFGNIVAFLQENGGKVPKRLNFCVKDAWDEVTGADGIELIRHLRTTLLRIGLEGDLLDRLDAALQRGLVRGGGSELKRVVALHLTPALQGLSAAIEALEGDQMLSTITGSDTEMDEDEDSSSDETGNGEDDGDDGNDGNDDEMKDNEEAGEKGGNEEEGNSQSAAAAAPLAKQASAPVPPATLQQTQRRAAATTAPTRAVPRRSTRSK